MEESAYPRLPPPLKYIKSPLLSVLPKYATELINAMWYATFSQEPLRYERVALAYHGLYIVDFFSPDDGFRVRQVQRTGSKDQLVAKRVSAGFQSEINILKILSDKSMEHHRNHTATPSHILWGDRMHITPLYHQLLMVSFTPNGVLNIAHQLIEAVAFLHEHRIAHLDISPRNFLLARNPRLPKLRLLLTDMEFAAQVAPGVEPMVDLWHDCLAPPEGKTSINGFAYDMLGVGLSISYFIQDCTLEPTYRDVQWPESFYALHEHLKCDTPEHRPSAKEAESIMRLIIDDPFSEYPQSTRQEDLDLKTSIRLLPTLAEPTPLPRHQYSRSDLSDC